MLLWVMGHRTGWCHRMEVDDHAVFENWSTHVRWRLIVGLDDIAARPLHI